MLNDPIRFIFRAFRTALWCYYVTYRPMKSHDVQSSKSAQPYWGNNNIY